MLYLNDFLSNLKQFCSLDFFLLYILERFFGKFMKAKNIVLKTISVNF